MIGDLPKRLNIGGKWYDIRTDYRHILRIIAAFNDPDLTDKDKGYVLMATIYPDLGSIPQEDVAEAYSSALRFIECSSHDDKKAPSPKVLDWEHDEQILFPAINKVAGFEVRSVDYMHWWTFLGHYQSIDREGTMGYILTLRQKKAKHKKLEKYEHEFWSANRDLCELTAPNTTAEAADDALKALFNDLLRGGNGNG